MPRKASRPQERLLVLLAILAVVSCIYSFIWVSHKFARPEFERILDSVVLLECEARISSKTLVYQGSGWFIDSKGTIVTAAHVVEGRRKHRVYIRRSSTPIPYYIVRLDNDLDVAILAPVKPLLSSKWLLPVVSEGVVIGDSVWTVGHPWDYSWMVHEGIVSRKHYLEAHREVDIRTPIVTMEMKIPFRRFMLATSSWVAPGVSGGPLVDRYGNVAGMVVQYYKGRNAVAVPQHINWCVPATDIIRFLEAY